MCEAMMPKDLALLCNVLFLCSKDGCDNKFIAKVHAHL